MSYPYRFSLILEPLLTVTCFKLRLLVVRPDNFIEHVDRVPRTCKDSSGEANYLFDYAQEIRLLSDHLVPCVWSPPDA